MTGQGSERPDKGKWVARPKKRRRQTPKYVLRVPAKLPTTAAPSPSSVGPPPTPTIQPPTPAVDPIPTSTIHPYHTPTAHPSLTPTADHLPPPVIITPTPPSMLITPTPPPDPTSIPFSSCIPSSETVTPSADPDSTGDGEGLDLALHDRPWIESYGKGFIPSRVASQAITRSIKHQLLNSWPTWGEILDDDKKPFWERFQIQRNFHMKASHRLSEMFRDARNAGERPYWLGEQIWNSLLAHWNSVEFRNKCAKAQRNKASEKGGTLHTGGSITIHEHVIRMAQALGRVVHVDEVFAQTHVRKGINEFVDERSRKTHEEFFTRLSHVRSEHRLAPTPDDASNGEDDISSKGGTLKHQPSSSTTTADEVVVRLTQALEQRDQEITDLRVEFRNFKALIMRVLPETSHDRFNIAPTQPRPSPSLVVPQQPTSVQPSSVHPTSVQPTPVEPSTEEQDDEDHSDDNYVHY
ncbi:hypothetical protein LR48_Vigan10g079600 [Vigna angularis]|uniref:Transposase, Ptta/En/Spm, plant n=1 Tax=Phaseolus angularis TaxID=3914 RepID=A0A0L9VJK1_PHAAN|nr:hypothetical protein LR48_Vigan10g079600 [Vigna angularis]